MLMQKSICVHSGALSTHIPGESICNDTKLIKIRPKYFNVLHRIKRRLELTLYTSLAQSRIYFWPMQSHDTTNVMIYLIGELDIFENQRFFILFINMGYLACFIQNDITSNNLIGLREGQYKTTCMGHSSDLYERAKCRSGLFSQ